MNSRTCTLLVLLLVWVGACSGEMAPPQAARGAAAEAEAAEATAEPQAATTTRKLVRTARLELAVDDPQAVAEQVERLAVELGGFIASMDGRRRDGLHYYDITVRVPGEQLEEALEALRALAAEVDRESARVEDVTDRYIDLDARIRTLEVTEEELRGMLAESRQRGRDVGDIMRIYNELTEIRSRIEQLKGQLNVLDNQISLATISVRLRPTAAARPVIEEGWQPGQVVRSSARALVRIVQVLVNIVIVVVIVIVPIVAILGLPVLLAIRLRRRYRQRRAGQAQKPGQTG